MGSRRGFSGCIGYGLPYPRGVPYNLHSLFNRVVSDNVSVSASCHTGFRPLVGFTPPFLSSLSYRDLLHEARTLVRLKDSSPWLQLVHSLTGV